jgi:hypothetical protein
MKIRLQDLFGPPEPEIPPTGTLRICGDMVIQKQSGDEYCWAKPCAEVDTPWVRNLEEESMERELVDAGSPYHWTILALPWEDE